MGRRLCIIFILLLILTACGDPSAIDRAEAAKILRETNAAIESTRVAQAYEIEIQKMEAQRELAEWELNYRRNTARKDAILIAVTVGTCIGILGLAIIFVKRTQEGTRHLTTAIGTWAIQKGDISSRLIKPDRASRAWPALLTEEGIHQLGNGRVLLLDVPRDLDSQAEWGDVLIRALGIAERGAKKVGTHKHGSSQSLDVIGATAAQVPRWDNPSEGTPLVNSIQRCQACDKNASVLMMTESPEGLVRACPSCRDSLLER